jgi:hypothetical protein
MKLQPDTASPWGKRIWIPDAEFEPTMDNLRARVEGSFTPGRGVDVDAIMLHVYNVTPDFGDVEDAGLGRTRFEVDGSYTVLVSRVLSDEATSSAVARRRLHSTLAHECAHIVFHSVLHPIHAGANLFEDLVEPRAVMCRRETIEGAPSTKAPWWEFQANRGMSCLLLPRDLLRTFLPEALKKRELADMRAALEANRARAVLQELMEVFDVSFEMTLYRLQELGFISKHVGQAGLMI